MPAAALVDSDFSRSAEPEVNEFGYGVCETFKMKTEPNNAMERSRILVTVRADARPAPSIRLAHLRR